MQITKEVRISQLQELDNGDVRATFRPVVEDAERRERAARGNPIGNQIFTEDLPGDEGPYSIGQTFELTLTSTE